MREKEPTISSRCLSAALVLLSLSAGNAAAQTHMQVTLADGRQLSVPVDSISGITVVPVVPEAIGQLEGTWQLIASANGSTDAYGISHAVTDTIAFTATAAPDGMGLVCHADRFYWRSGKSYPATWRTLVEEDEAGRLRLGWVFSAEQPASEPEFDETADKYMDGGFFYWGDGTEEHHYIYLLTENIDTQRLEGMTLWSGWTEQNRPTFVFPQNQGVYGVVSATIPYSAASSTGYFERWASPRFERK